MEATIISKIKGVAYTAYSYIKEYPEIKDKVDLCAHYRKINNRFAAVFGLLTVLLIITEAATAIQFFFDREMLKTLPGFMISWTFADVATLLAGLASLKISKDCNSPNKKHDFAFQSSVHSKLQLLLTAPTFLLMLFPLALPLMDDSSETASLCMVIGVGTFMHICAWATDGIVYKIALYFVYNGVYCFICIQKGYFTRHNGSRFFTPLIMPVAFIINFDKYTKENFLLKQQLKRQKNMYEKHLENVQDPVLIMNKRQLVFSNEASRKTVGETLESFYAKAGTMVSPGGKSLGKLISQNFADDTVVRERILHEKYFIRNRVPEAKAYKRTIDVTMMESRCYQGEKLISLTLHDETEDLMREEARVEEKYKNMLLFSLSHELRTPLNIFQAFLDVSKPLMKTSEATDMRKNAKGAWRYLRNKISDILDYAQILTGEFVLHKHTFSLRRFIGQLKKITHCLLDQKSASIKLDFSVAEGVSDDLVEDRDRLEQVLFNLLSNAVKYTTRGTISLRVFAFPYGMGNITFEVRDTGCGMSSESVRLLFELRSLHPSSSSVTHKQKSTSLSGLGLTVSKLICNRMDSDIEVDSALDKGSTFSFNIPLPQPFRPDELSLMDLTLIPEEGCPNSCRSLMKRKEGRSYTKTEAQLCKRLVVLVVDDNHLNRFVANNMAQKFGAHTEEAANGKAAIERLEELQERLPGSTFLVLMDIDMPVMDGIEACVQIRKMNKKPRPQIVALTAFASEGERGKCIAAGMDGFISKPLTKQALLDTLKSMQIIN